MTVRDTEARSMRIPSAAELIRAARDLIPYLRGQAAECENQRRVSDATIAQFTRAGLFNIVKPRRYGGYELGWDVFDEVVMNLASGCGSSGWVFSVVGGHAAVVTRFGSMLLDEIWHADADALLSSCRRTSGELIPVNGGYRGSGTGAFSSGCLNASWVIVDGIPVQGAKQPLCVVLPMKDVEIQDTWKVMGLAGTGSHDIKFSDVFIPDHRTWSPGATVHGDVVDAPIFRFVHLGGPLVLPAVILGIAHGGLEHFVAMTHKRAARQGGSVADLQSMQMRIGESAIQIDATLALLRSKLTEVMAKLSGAESSRSGPAGELCAVSAILASGGTSARYDHLTAGFIAHSAYDALNRLMSAAGAGQLSLSSPFQRCFRDALAGLQQPSNSWDIGRTSGGRDILERFQLAVG